MGQFINASGKILRHPAALQAAKAGEKLGPINFELDISNACNLGCRHCDFAQTHDGRLMSEELGRRVLEQLAAAGAMAVTFSGGGEPSMNPALPALARHAHDLGLQVGLYTNGTLGSRVTEALYEFTWVYVSVDAVTAEAWRQLKAKGEKQTASLFWETLGLVQFASLYKEDAGRSLPTIGMGFLIDGNWTARMLDQALKLGDCFGADYVQFRPIVGLDHYRWVPSALEALRKRRSSFCLYSEQRFLRLSEQPERGYKRCLASALVPCVGAGGELWVCPNTRLLRPLGSLAEEEFAALWERRPEQEVGEDCRIACRNDELNETLAYVCGEGPHDAFV